MNVDLHLDKSGRVYVRISAPGAVIPMYGHVPGVSEDMTANEADALADQLRHVANRCRAQNAPKPRRLGEY